MSKIVGKQIGDIPGTMKDYCGGTVPPYYLLCDGSSVAVATYPGLFAVIGYTFGGSGANFNLPDSRRKTMIGSGGTATGTIGNTVGSTGGEEAHILSNGELAAHSHGINDPGHTHDTGTVSNVALSGPGGFVVRVTNPANPVASASHQALVTAQITGNSQAHNTMQPSLVVTKMIKI